jgi:Tfp pilus assembly protein PilN
MRAVNLIPSDSRGGLSPVVARSGGAAYAVLAVLGGLAVLALLYGIAHHQVSSRRAQIATLTAKAQRAQAEAGQLAPYTNFIALREQRTHAVSDLVDARFDWAHAFHELGRVLPHDASINSLDGTVGASGPGGTTAAAAPAATATSAAAGASAGPAVASATPPGSVPTFTLSGCATSQKQVALTLTRLRLIDGVSEVTLQSSTKPATSSGTAAAAGSCEGGDPAFTIQVTFAGLPSSATIGSATKLTSQSGAAR